MTRCEKGFSEIRSPGKFTTRTSQPAIIQWICLVNWITKIQSNPSYQTHIPATYHNVPQIWGFPELGYPKMVGLQGKIPLKWMIQGYPYFRKHQKHPVPPPPPGVLPVATPSVHPAPKPWLPSRARDPSERCYLRRSQWAFYPGTEIFIFAGKRWI